MSKQVMLVGYRAPEPRQPPVWYVVQIPHSEMDKLAGGRVSA